MYVPFIAIAVDVDLKVPHLCSQVNMKDTRSCNSFTINAHHTFCFTRYSCVFPMYMSTLYIPYVVVAYDSEDTVDEDSDTDTRPDVPKKLPVAPSPVSIILYMTSIYLIYDFLTICKHANICYITPHSYTLPNLMQQNRCYGDDTPDIQELCTLLDCVCDV